MAHGQGMFARNQVQEFTWSVVDADGEPIGAFGKSIADFETEQEARDYADEMNAKSAEEMNAISAAAATAETTAEITAENRYERYKQMGHELDDIGCLPDGTDIDDWAYDLMTAEMQGNRKDFQQWI